MTMSAKQAESETDKPPFPNMVWIPGGTFLMGSDKHYQAEHAHRAGVSFQGEFRVVIPDRGERWLQREEGPSMSLAAMAPAGWVLCLTSLSVSRPSKISKRHS